jgi:hypothetical protein
MTAIPCPIAAAGVSMVTGAPRDPDLGARIGCVCAGHDLDECRLAGAVLPHQRVHLAGRGDQMCVGERPHPGKGLGDAPHFQQGRRRCRHRHIGCIIVHDWQHSIDMQAAPRG